jgi:hypothetical protein
VVVVAVAGVVVVVLGNGGGLSSGLVSLNPYIVKNTGTAFLTLAIAGTPPSGQQLDMEIISATLGFVSRISIADGVTTLQQTTLTTASPAALILFKDDTLTVSVAYSSIGANPVPAQNVTLSLRISY